MPDLRSTGRPPVVQMIAAFAAIYVIWGSTYLAIRVALETMPPFFMAGARFLLAGAVLYGWTRLRGEGRPTPRQWLSATIVGGLLLLGGNGLVVFAEQSVPSGLAALLIATEPLWIVMLDWARRGGKRPSLGVAAGLMLGFVGVALLIGPGMLGGSGAIDLLGAALLVAAACSWAAGSLYSRHAGLPSAPLLTTGMQMLAGGTLLLGAGLLNGDAGRLNLPAISLNSWLAFGYLVVFGSLVAFTAYVWLLRVASASRVSTYAYVNPVIAVFLGWSLAGEPLTPRTLLAAAIIVAAVAVITIVQSRSSAPAPAQSVRDPGAVRAK